MRRIRTFPLVFVLGFAGPAIATVLDPAWTESVAGVNLDAPGDTVPKGHTALGWAPDGSDRLFVLEKSGRVRLMKGFTTTGTPTWSTFATMSPIVTTSECGLLGLAFDPNFAVNKLVYFFVTSTSNSQEIIRYDASGDIGTNRTVVMTGLPTRGLNNNGGGIAFGPDGKLYFSVGELGNATGVDDLLTTLAAKVGRANRDGTLPPDNPFADGPGPNNDFVFARGFRNPYSMTFQPGTGRLWLNVAGNNFEQVFQVGSGDHGGFDTYENNQPAAGYITPVIAYRTTGSESFLLSAATRSGNIATFTTTTTHRFRLGANITIAGLMDNSFNGTVYVASVGSATTFSATKAGPDATTIPAGSASATALLQGGPAGGGAVTGGAFYSGTLAPADYRGNFFYGDYVSGRIMRTTIDAVSNAVRTTDYWATSINGQVDIAPGPDGTLYYTGFLTANIYRAAYNAQAQGIVVSEQNLRVEEGRSSVLTVRLAIAPAGAVTVAAARTSGDSDISVSGGASLDFSAANWSIPQVVTIAAGADADTLEDTATVSLLANGLTTIPVTIRGLDDNTVPLPDLLVDGFESP